MNNFTQESLDPFGDTTDDPFGDGETEIGSAPTAPAEPLPSEKQLAFVRRLREERGLSLTPEPTSKRDASKLIDALLATPKPRTTASPQGDPPEGVHKVQDTFYKVQVAKQGSGKKYAKQFDPASQSWEYLGRSREFYKLGEGTLLTLEDAKKFGHLYGQCCVCGRTLTDEGSIAAGIGPVCAQGF